MWVFVVLAVKKKDEVVMPRYGTRTMSDVDQIKATCDLLRS